MYFLVKKTYFLLISNSPFLGPERLGTRKLLYCKTSFI
nr:MAG TPA: hypothetical protein [Caudoviricetes sp.]